MKPAISIFSPLIDLIIQKINNNQFHSNIKAHIHSSLIINHPIVGADVGPVTGSIKNIIFILINTVFFCQTYGGLLSALSVPFYIPVYFGLIALIIYIFWYAFSYLYPMD